MRVSDLLRMSTGHQAEAGVAANAQQPWTKTFLAQPVPFKPGTHFLYNTPATYMAVGDRPEGDGADDARLPQAAPL